MKKVVSEIIQICLRKPLIYAKVNVFSILKYYNNVIVPNTWFLFYKSNSLRMPNKKDID